VRASAQAAAKPPAGGWRYEKQRPTVRRALTVVTGSRGRAALSKRKFLHTTSKKKQLENQERIYEKRRPTVRRTLTVATGYHRESGKGMPAPLWRGGRYTNRAAAGGLRTDG
jgi:hypothetical protein